MEMSRPSQIFLMVDSCHAVVSSTDDVLQGGLRNAAAGTQPVEGELLLCAVVEDSLSDSLFDGHRAPRRKYGLKIGYPMTSKMNYLN